jgi:hypothetical protein
MPIGINLNKAKEIAHNKRRVDRANEFAPLDIKVTIPSESVKAEEERQKIREKYNVMQVEIDNATSVEQLKQIIS